MFHRAGTLMPRRVQRSLHALGATGLFDPTGSRHLSKSVIDLHRRSGLFISFAASARLRRATVELRAAYEPRENSRSVKTATFTARLRQRNSEPFTPPWV